MSGSPPRHRSIVIEAVATALLGTLVLVLGTALRPSFGEPATDATVLHQLVTGQHVAVVPQRPGWNLLMLPDGNAAAGTDRDRLTPATSRPGAAGSWVLLRLPEGSSKIFIRSGGRVTALTIRTGAGLSPADLSGPDGPECATAIVGARLALGSPPAACPAQALRPADAAALRVVMDFAAGRGSRTVTLVEDGSPRSSAAADVVRAAAARAGVTVTAPDHAQGPLVVTSGWAAAAATLTALSTGRLRAEGAYLAPWLLSTPLLKIPAGALLPLPYSPFDEVARRYLGALGTQLSGGAPTGSGYRAWLDAQRAGAALDAAPIRLYAPASMDLHAALIPRGRGHDAGAAHAHGTSGRAEWIPGGRLTAVTGPLSPATP